MEKILIIEDDEIIYYKCLTLNQKSKQVSINGKEIKLTPTKFKVLEVLSGGETPSVLR
ncbi:hypothetical protein [Clostridium sp.]|uniref:hypothetical protein n=1 Tax=Clostridium sp. TaxID=1506 RepID=UPI0032169628